jgi:hypothetical protein
MVNWWRYKLEDLNSPEAFEKITKSIQEHMTRNINNSILGISSLDNKIPSQTTVTQKDVEDIIEKMVNAYEKMPPTHTFSSFVYKDKIVNRTWKERLFTLPWKPWTKTKIIKEPAIYETPYGIVAHTCFQRELENIK